MLSAVDTLTKTGKILVREDLAGAPEVVVFDNDRDGADIVRFEISKEAWEALGRPLRLDIEVAKAGRLN